MVPLMTSCSTSDPNCNSRICTSKSFQTNVHEKESKYKDEKTYEIVETVDLLDYYKQNFKNENTIRVVKTENGRITSILYDDNVIVCVKVTAADWRRGRATKQSVPGWTPCIPRLH